MPPRGRRGKNGLGNFSRTARMGATDTGSQALAMGRTTNVEVLLKLGEPDSDAPDGWGDNLFLTIISGGKYVAFGLTTQTAEEIRTIRRILNLSLGTALEIAIERDRIAEEAAQDGDDSFHRLHRGVPNFLIRSGVESKHHPCVCDGREALVLGSGTDKQNVQPVDSGDGSNAVAQQPPTDLGASDVLPEGDQPSVVPQVAGLHQPADGDQAANGGDPGATPLARWLIGY